MTPPNLQLAEIKGFQKCRLAKRSPPRRTEEIENSNPNKMCLAPSPRKIFERFFEIMPVR